jgi:AraC-like DNA-binding protein
MSMRDAIVGYDEVAQSVAILRPRLPRLLSCIVHLHGGDPARLCAGLGFSHQDLNDPERRFSFRQLGEMLRRTLRALPDPGVLIRAAGEAKITAYDMLGLAQLSCPRLREALELGVEFQRLAGMPADLSLEESGAEFSFILDEWYHDPEIGPFLIEMTCAFVVNEIGLMLGRKFAPVRVELAYPTTPGRAAYRELFDCRVIFGAARNRIVGRRALLDEALTTHDRLTHDSLVVDLRRAVVAQPGDLLEAVGHALRKNLRNPPSVTELAASMHMSERTLRRRLADMEVNVRDLLAQARIAVARRLLHDQHRSVAEVADQVGFSSPESLRRALRRSTGARPGALRPDRRMLADSDRVLAVQALPGSGEGA